MPEINEGQYVVPSPKTKSSPPVMAQLARRTSLSEEELCAGRIKVRRTDEKGHAVMVHPRLAEPFSCHTKFFEPAPQQ
jgi:hypothetical protein